MITVQVSEKGIQMQGHACRSVNGQDIVCAAVSALTCSMINSLHELAGMEVRERIENGMTVVEWERLSEKGKLLIDSWFIGLMAINQEYSCIKFI